MEKLNLKKPFWSFTYKEIFSDLKAKSDGLRDEEVKKRQKEYGLNELHEEYRLTKIKIFLKQLQSPLIFILIIASVVTVVMGEFTDAAVIILAIVVNTILGFYQENRAENSLERLRSYIKERARVMRGGKEHEIDAKQLVPGDIIHLSYGSRVPADARLISIKNFSVDESILTGESLPVTKITEELPEATSLPERKNMIHAGTLVVEGYAKAIITSTGIFTEIGRISQMVKETKREKTPLQIAVWKLAWIIAIATTIIISGVFILGIYRGEPIIEMFLISTAVAVGAIPEALPIVLTVVLAVGVERLAKEKGLMRNLAAAETLGSTSVVMTDKTGTLTKAQLELVDIITKEKILNNSQKVDKKNRAWDEKQKNLLRLAVFNTDVIIENQKEGPKKWQLLGRPIEKQIVAAAGLNGIDPEKLKKTAASFIAITFNSKNKFSVSCQENPQKIFPNEKSDRTYVILGAPDIILEKSKIDKDSYLKILKRIEESSSEGKRLVGLAIMKEGNKKTEQIGVEDVKDLEFMGIFAFFDPIRPAVPAAIKKIEQSGVRVIMATGDLKGTALSVAKGLGWKVSEAEVLTGDDLEKISDEELSANIDRIKVYARVTPEDKKRIAILLKKKGEIVGMTGDGVNDAPSLKAVDIGIAVGSGSDVAKEVADLVLLDDNFETIVKAIEEGRRILSNIRKSFVYLMSNSLDSIFLIGGSLLLGLPLPLTALQIIWVNFFSDSLPALSYAFDDFIDKEKTTVKSSRKILDSEVKVLVIGIGTLTSVLLLAFYWVLLNLDVPKIEVKTFVFACFASYTLFVAFSLRSLKKSIFSYNPFSNHFLSWSVGGGLALIAVTIYVPFLQKIFGTVALAPYWLILLALWLIVNLSMVEAVKWAYRNK